MNGITNEAQLLNNGLWYYDVSEKEMSLSSRLRQINSNRHKQKEKFGIVGKEYEIIKPEIDEIDYRDLIMLLKIVEIIFFHTFEYRCVYDIEFANITNNEEPNSTITRG